MSANTEPHGVHCEGCQILDLRARLAAAEAELTRRDTVIADVQTWCDSHDRPEAPPQSREEWMLTEVSYVACILNGFNFDRVDGACPECGDDPHECGCDERAANEVLNGRKTR